MRILQGSLVVALSVLVGCVAGEDEFEGEEPSYEVTEEDQAADAEVDAATQDGKEDSTLSYLAVAKVAHTAGVSCTGDRLAIAVAVAKAESGFRTGATNTAGNAHGIDRGLWQINSYWHPEVSATCAFSASCNARAMARISNYGRSWSQWWTYNNGKHLQFMSQARAAKATVCGG
jgi:hypothetical protein